MLVPCPNCQNEVQADQQFCRRCGWKLSAPLVSPSNLEESTRRLPNAPYPPDPRQTGQMGATTGPATGPTPYPAAPVYPPIRRRSAAKPIIIILLLMAIVAGGVILAVTAFRKIRPRETMTQVQRNLTQTFTFPDTGQINLANVRGQIKVSVWENSTVEFTATQRRGNDKPLEEMLEITATDKLLDVKLREGRATIDYELKVPQKLAQLTLTSVNGDISIDGIESTIQTTTVNGKINLVNVAGSVRTNSVNGDQTIRFRAVPKDDLRLNAVNGDIQLDLPGEPDAQVNISSTSGDIESQFPLEVNNRPGSRTARGVFGKGSKSLSIQTVSGDINLNRVVVDQVEKTLVPR